MKNKTLTLPLLIGTLLCVGACGTGESIPDPVQTKVTQPKEAAPKETTPIKVTQPVRPIKPLSQMIEAHDILKAASTGIKLKMEQTCTLPADLPPTSAIPQGGAKEPVTSDASAWAPYNVTIEESMYFTYSGKQEGSSDYILKAKSNFNTSNPQMHTISQTIAIEKSGTTCTVNIRPSWTMNEFE